MVAQHEATETENLDEALEAANVTPIAEIGGATPAPEQLQLPESVRLRVQALVAQRQVLDQQVATVNARINDVVETAMELLGVALPVANPSLDQETGIVTYNQAPLTAPAAMPTPLNRAARRRSGRR